MLSPTETQIVDLLRTRRATPFRNLAENLRVSLRTVQRVLRKVGYYSSINRNSSWATLEETPRFDPEGLWSHEGVCFSLRGSLVETVKALVHHSDEGRTVGELEKRVLTRVHQAVGSCLREKQIGRFYLGRNAVYVSAEKDVAASQEARRRGRLETEARRSFAAKREAGALPEGLDALTIIRLLVRMLVSPEASIASLSKTLQAEQLDIDAERIRRVIDFYDLPQKKTAH